MTLPQELAQAFRTNRHRFEEDKKVEYISSVERMAIEEGLQQGLQQGLQEGLRQSILDTLDVRFGGMPGDLPERLALVAAESELRALQRRAVTIESLAAFTDLLPGLTS